MMPWHISKGGGTCGSGEWAVIKDSDGSTAGCHDTEAAAKRQLAALYAKEPQMSSVEHPKDNLVRALVDEDAVHLREEGDPAEGRTLYGHFAVFDKWAEIDSVFEGRFMERVAPGAFDRTIAERRDKIRVLYDHGMDPQLGNKPLGSIRELRADAKGGYYEVDLLDVPYVNEFIIPATRAGTLGASFRMSVKGEQWNDKPKASRHNPTKLPERTITDIDLYEFGPVTFPAYAQATAGIRSVTDDFYEQLSKNPVFMARFIERAGLGIVEKLLEVLPPTARDDSGETAEPTTSNGDAPPADSSADGQPSRLDHAARQQYARRLYVARNRVGKRFT